MKFLKSRLEDFPPRILRGSGADSAHLPKQLQTSRYVVKCRVEFFSRINRPRMLEARHAGRGNQGQRFPLSKLFNRQPGPIGFAKSPGMH